MLRNAFRGTESFLTSRAIYDGAESMVRYNKRGQCLRVLTANFKDGLSIVNIILRNGEAEGIDHETLLYCFLKVSTRDILNTVQVLVRVTLTVTRYPAGSGMSHLVY